MKKSEFLYMRVYYTCYNFSAFPTFQKPIWNEKHGAYEKVGVSTYVCVCYTCCQSDIS